MAIITLPDGRVELRPITGADENAIHAADLPNALALLDRLLEGGRAARLTSAARDRALAALYTAIYGDNIRAVPACPRCGTRYELMFSLKALAESLPVQPPLPDGTYRTGGGMRFRLPRGEDEIAVIGLPPDAARLELMRRCAPDINVSDSAAVAAVEVAMEAAAPLLNVDLSARCPECGAEQSMWFDVGTYLLEKLIADQARLAMDVHVLAVSYHWSLNEILSLTRSDRRRYLSIIEAEADRAALRASSRTSRAPIRRVSS